MKEESGRTLTGYTDFCDAEYIKYLVGYRKGRITLRNFSITIKNIVYFEVGHITLRRISMTLYFVGYSVVSRPFDISLGKNNSLQYRPSHKKPEIRY